MKELEISIETMQEIYSSDFAELKYIRQKKKDECLNSIEFSRFNCFSHKYNHTPFIYSYTECTYNEISSAASASNTAQTQ